MSNKKSTQLPREPAVPKLDSLESKHAEKENLHGKKDVLQHKTYAGNSNSQRSRYSLGNGMTEEAVRMELFIIEGLNGFEKLTIREKISVIMQNSSDGVKRRIFEFISTGNKVEDWPSFVEWLMNTCTGKTLDNVRRYKDEKWSSYMERIQEFAIVRKIDKESILNFLRRQYLPLEIKTMLYSNQFELETMIRFSRDYEETAAKRAIRVEKRSRNEPVEKKETIRCYKCGKMGHIAKNCRQGNLYNIHERESPGNDLRRVKLNETCVNVVFDTGADRSYMCSGMVKKIAPKYTYPHVSKYALFDGTEGISRRRCLYEMEFKGRKTIISFTVVENDGITNTVIGNQDLLRIVEQVKKFPIECEIKTVDDRPVSWSRPIRSWTKKQEFYKLLENLDERGIIEPSTSLWLNPVVLTQKKDTGKLRFCVDFRRLNEKVEQDNFELPKIREMLSQLANKSIFSLIDLKDGFFQVNLKEEDRKKTAFFSGKQLLQFKKMPQGYKNSPAIFQRAMNIILNEYIGKCCVVYIDDILCYGNDENEHNENLEKVLKRLYEYDIVINYSKTKFGMKMITFLGYEIGYGKIKPSIQRSQGIQSLKKPLNKKQLQKFLGATNYDRMFIKNFTELAKPLYELLCKDQVFVWQDRHQKAFEELKKQWAYNLELIIPNNTEEFTLETDASAVGLGAVLKQGEKPVCYISRSLTRAESQYSTIEKECLAALWSMEKLEEYLLGRKFRLVTDNKAIEELNKKLEFGSHRIRRWFERFQRFQFYVEHVPGEKNEQADFLSRYGHVQDEKNNKIEIMKLHTKHSHRKNLLRKCKEQGIETTNVEIQDVLKGCETCARFNEKNKARPIYIKSQKPGEILAVDIMQWKPGELIIVGIDYFSRKIWAKYIRQKLPKNVERFLEDVYKECPFINLKCDNGKEFENKIIKNWGDLRGINIQYTIPYLSKSNGRVERANRTIRNGLLKAKGPIKRRLEKVVKIYNEMDHRGIGMSPNEAMKEKNWYKVTENSEKHSREFKGEKDIQCKIKVGDTVLIKNEHRVNKRSPRFREKGKIVENIGFRTYLVEKDNGKVIKRHLDQLKVFKGGELKHDDRYRDNDMFRAETKTVDI